LFSALTLLGKIENCATTIPKRATFGELWSTWSCSAESLNPVDCGCCGEVVKHQLTHWFNWLF